jgi:protein NirF
VLHVRWSDEKPRLYISVNDANRVAVIDTTTWREVKSIDGIKKPSGIFIYKESK